MAILAARGHDAAGEVILLQPKRVLDALKTAKKASPRAAVRRGVSPASWPGSRAWARSGTR